MGVPLAALGSALPPGSARWPRCRTALCLAAGSAGNPAGPSGPA